MTDLLLSLAGCERKLSSTSLDRVLSALPPIPGEARLDPRSRSEDASIWEADDGSLWLGSVDFSPPISADPEFSGRVAAANAISDIYAMGGRPLFALAILGAAPSEAGERVAQAALAALSDTCVESGCLLAGGHTLAMDECVIGLSVTGRVSSPGLRLKSMGVANDLLVLTKPLGTGLLFAAARCGLLAELPSEAVTAMRRLNTEGPDLAALPGVHAMTDVTGFGLLGHLVEVCRASGVNAQLDFEAVPLFDFVEEVAKAALPHPALESNWASVRSVVTGSPDREVKLLSDPQINGGLLLSVAPEELAGVEETLGSAGIALSVIGSLTERGASPPTVEVRR